MKEFSRYERQYILKQIGREGQRLLDKSHVAIIGLGALGSVSADLLARAGVGHLHLIDRDFLEMNNLQRQILYDEKDLAANLPKAVAAQKKLSAINSEIQIKSEVVDISPETIDEMLSKTSLIIDGTDNFETRFLINDYSLKNKIPWIYGGAIQTEGMSYVILPGQGPCLRCLFGESPAVGDAQTCDQVGILAPVAHLIASFQAVEAIKILAHKYDDIERKLWKVNIWSREFRSISVAHLKKNPCSGCKKGDYPYLRRHKSSRTVKLCGRNSVQILPPANTKANLSKLAAHLARQAEVDVNDYLMRIRLKSHEITLFANGRAIIKGTEDAEEAKRLYAKYVGL